MFFYSVRAEGWGKKPVSKAHETKEKTTSGRENPATPGRGREITKRLSVIRKRAGPTSKVIVDIL